MKQAVLPHSETASVVQRLNLLQFMSVAVAGIATPFFTLFLVDVGMSATAIGILLSIGAFLELVLTPILNTVADRRNLHRRLFIMYVALFATATLIYANTNLIWLLAIALLMVEVSLRPSMTLAMQLTMTRIEQLKLDILGRIRSFAPLGYAVASFSATPLFNLGGFRLLFWVSSLLSVMTVYVSNVLPEYIASKEIKTAPPKRRRGFYVLAISQFFVTMGIRAGYAFWLIHVSRNLGLPTAQIGLFMAFVAGVEIPFFILLDPIMKRFNPRIIYILGCIGMGLFFIALGFTPNIFWLVVLNLIRGFIWPMYNLPIFVVTSQISHPRNVATNQAIINITMPSIAVFLTGSIAGWLFDTQAVWIFFVACAITCFIGAIISIIGYRTLAPIKLAE